MDVLIGCIYWTVWICLKLGYSYKFFLAALNFQKLFKLLKYLLSNSTFPRIFCVNKTRYVQKYLTNPRSCHSWFTSEITNGTLRFQNYYSLHRQDSCPNKYMQSFSSKKQTMQKVIWVKSFGFVFHEIINKVECEYICIWLGWQIFRA